LGNESSQAVSGKISTGKTADVCTVYEKKWPSLRRLSGNACQRAVEDPCSGKPMT